MANWSASPVTQTDFLQMAKAAASAMVAWWIAEVVLGLDQAYLSPWVALLTVHVTVYRTVVRGGQTLLSVGLGVLVAFVVVQLLGATFWALGIAVLIGLVIGRPKLLRYEGTTTATTALFVTTGAYTMTEQRAIELVPGRLLDTVIGVAVALVINLIVFPPLNDRSAQRQIDDVDRRLGQLLVDMANQIRDPVDVQEEDDWIERTRSIDRDLRDAWALVTTAQESRRANVRRLRRSTTDVHSYPEVLKRLEEGIAQTRSIARHLRESTQEANEWDPRFRGRFLDLLADVGHRVADPQSDVAPLREGLRHLADDLSDQDLSGLLWPLYGALIANLRIIVDVVDDVASAQPVRAT